MRRFPSKLVLYALGAAACFQDPVQIHTDLPTFQDGRGEAVDLTGDPTLTPGVYVEDAFLAFGVGDELLLIDGVQGGRWVHVSLRIGAMRREGDLGLALRREGPSGELIAEVAYHLRLTPTDAGVLEAYDVPLPIPLSEAEVAALAGLPAHLTSTYASAGRSASSEMALVFAVE